MTNRIAWGFALIFITGGLTTFSNAIGPATTQAVDDAQLLQSWWDDLEKPEPWSARALLDFSTRPTQAVAFFKEHLRPLKIDQKELDDALKALSSDDEKVWKPAFDKLGYFDPRLNVELDTLMESQTEPVGRYRLAAILTDEQPDKFKDDTLTIYRQGANVYFLATKGNNQNYCQVKTDIAKLDTPTSKEKRKWLRADLAIVLLQHIDTPEAIAVLREMTTGHPNAEPTKIAKLAVQSLEVRR